MTAREPCVLFALEREEFLAAVGGNVQAGDAADVVIAGYPGSPRIGGSAV